MRDRSAVLPHLIAAHAERDGDRPFLQHVDGTSLTFGAFHEQALRWAGALQRSGVVAGDRVAVMLPPSFDAIAAWLGIAWLRAIEVPIHTAYRGRMLEYTLGDAQPRVAIVGTEFLERFEELGEQLPPDLLVLRHGAERSSTLPDVRATSTVLAGAPATGLEGPEPHDISSILYTSGTTGPSKGVLVPWGHAHATATGCIPIEGLTADDVWYSPYPLFHASGKIPIYAMALLGGRVVVRERFVGREFWSDVERFGCTTTMMIGASAGYIADQWRQAGMTASPLRNVLVSPPPADPQAFEAQFGIRICSCFNMTELGCPISSGWRPLTDRGCGKVRPGYECRIVDEHDHELPPGTPGELIVRASEPWTMNAGYWQMPGKTAEAWRNGWFHTGDVCMQSEDGEFYFLDRIKDAIRRRGENISSMEVEVAAIEHEAVLEAAAVGVPAEHGEEEVKLVVTVADRERFDPAELLRFLSPRMPRFMIPRYVEVIDAMPMTSTAKVRKDALRESGVAHAWDRERAGVVLPA